MSSSPAEMGQQPQLDLRVIGGHQQPALGGQERLADLLALLPADRDVLQVRIAGRQPARGGHGLVERRMDPPGQRIDQRRQGIDIGALELGDLAVLEDLPGQCGRGVIERGQLFQRLLVRAGGPGYPRSCAAAASLQLVEQHRPQLHQRVDGERMARQAVYLFLDLLQLPAHVRAELAQIWGCRCGCRWIPARPAPRSAGFPDRHRAYAASPRGARAAAAGCPGPLAKLRFEQAAQPPGHVGILAGIDGHAFRRHLVHAQLWLLPAFLPDQVCRSE